MVVALQQKIGAFIDAVSHGFGLIHALDVGESGIPSRSVPVVNIAAQPQPHFSTI
jgi:hypothetical protein